MKLPRSPRSRWLFGILALVFHSGSQGVAGIGPVAERQVLARNGAKLPVGFQVTDPVHFMAVIRVEKRMTAFVSGLGGQIFRPKQGHLLK
jgi:hypothetical protein